MSPLSSLSSILTVPVSSLPLSVLTVSTLFSLSPQCLHYPIMWSLSEFLCAFHLNSFESEWSGRVTDPVLGVGRCDASPLNHLLGLVLWFGRGISRWWGHRDQSDWEKGLFCTGVWCGEPRRGWAAAHPLDPPKRPGLWLASLQRDACGPGPAVGWWGLEDCAQAEDEPRSGSGRGLLGAGSCRAGTPASLSASQDYS